MKMIIEDFKDKFFNYDLSLNAATIRAKVNISANILHTYFCIVDLRLQLREWFDR